MALTILIFGSFPSGHLLQARLSPKCTAFSSRILQTLFDLDALILLNIDAKDRNILVRSVKCLMASSVLVADIFTDDSPVFEVEEVFLQNTVGVD